MSRPADLPTTFAHGTRARYVGQRCRCDACRKANREYARQRARAAVDAARQAPASDDGRKRCMCGTKLYANSICGICNDCRHKLIYNGAVDATPVREHLLKLRAQGVGYRQVVDAAGVGRTTLQNVMSGLANTIRADSLRRILEVDGNALSDRARVPAAPTHSLIRRMMDEDGFTRAEIAKRAGVSLSTLYSTRSMMFARIELRVRQLYNIVHHGEDDGDAPSSAICTACGVAHGRQHERRALIARAPLDAETIMARYSCIYGSDTKGPGYRKLMRDLSALRRGDAQPSVTKGA
jgi:transcriptional regulator with XRE-family HTH domain